MVWLAEWIADGLERVRTTRRPQLLWRLIIVAAGLVSMISLLVVAPAWPVAVIAAVLLIMSALAPAGHLPTAWVLLIGCWLVGAGSGVGAGAGWLVVVPVAAGALVVHGVCAMVAPIPGFAVVDRRVWRAGVVPTLLALGATAAAVVVMMALGGLRLPPAPVVAGAVAVLAVVAVAAVLWPPRTRQVEATPVRTEPAPRAMSAWAAGDEDTRRG